MAKRADCSPRRLGELAAVVGGVVRGDPDRPITGVSGLSEAEPGEIAFYNNIRYRKALDQTRASAVLVQAALAEAVKGPDVVQVADPYLAFAQIATVFHPPPEPAAGIDPRAVVEPGAEVHPTATVMAFCYVGPRARVGPGAVLFPFVFLGESASVGERALLYPHVVVRERCSIGDRAILQPGVVIGGDGFGFAFDRTRFEHVKIPQAGQVDVQADVEIGSNSSVDRATFGQTVIGAGSKLDSLVQVAHNVQVGPRCILCGQVGLAGSSKLGQGVVCGGQVGIANHVSVASGTRIAAQSGVKDNIAEAGDYFGSPVIPLAEAARAQVAFRHGAETMQTVRRLEKRIAELEAKLAALGER